MPLQATSGAASYDAFGGGVPVIPNYIEDVFSTYLYTGNGTSQTITNGIDLSTKGGLVWVKRLNSGGRAHRLYDTLRGVYKEVYSNLTTAQVDRSSTSEGLSQFNTNGFSFGASNYDGTNESGVNYASWTFRKQPKFFDVITWTGDGTNGRTIAHSLAVDPGMVIVKKTSATSNWPVYHYALGYSSGAGRLNTTEAWGGVEASPITASSATTITLYNGTEAGGETNCNLNGVTYVAYLFANNAGGFGLTGTDNVITTGFFTTNGSGTATANLGYEPQFVMVKSAFVTGDWYMVDTMRGFVNPDSISSSDDARLYANTSDVENLAAQVGYPTSTGFVFNAGTASTFYIYIAIRRGPMKVPTSGTSVFNTVLWTGNETQNREITGVGFSADFVEGGTRGVDTTFARLVVDRLRGVNKFVMTSRTNTEASGSDLVSFNNDGITVNYADSGSFNNASNIYGHFFRRAPSFFDEVCAAGTSTSNQRISHNLTVVPELIIAKGRDRANSWAVYSGSINSIIYLNSTSAMYTDGSYFPWGTSAPTTTDFGINSGTIDLDNFNGVFYLFATCAGVSKVGSYTGNGSTQTINCGFGAGGARFVLIRRTDSTGDWYVYDTARGMTTLTDPYLLLNTSAAESATLGSVTTVSTGFALNSTILAAINVSGGTYIFLAIA